MGLASFSKPGDQTAEKSYWHGDVTLDRSENMDVLGALSWDGILLAVSRGAAFVDEDNMSLNLCVPVDASDDGIVRVRLAFFAT